MIVLALAGAMSAVAATGAHAAVEDARGEGVLVGVPYESPVAAVRAALASRPAVVVGFGELHQTRATVNIPSALRRFTDQILPAFADRFSHLVVETWMATGRCGESERAVTADVEKTTERPASTETEIETLIRKADAAGTIPRILGISCADYQAMRAAGGSVDYDKTLRITARALESAVLRGLRDRWAPAGRRSQTPGPDGAPAAVVVPVDPSRPLVGVYGGALHNDLHPVAGLEPYSFAPAVMAATLGRYLEIDLVVPEYAAGSVTARTSNGQGPAQSWWRAYLKARARAAAHRRGVTVLIERSPRSFVIVFPAQPKAGKGAPP